MWRRKIIEILILLLQWDWSFNRFPAEVALTEEQERQLWAMLWENASFRKYALIREADLLRKIGQQFVANKPVQAANAAGQLVEFLIIRDKAFDAFKTKRNQMVRRAQLDARAREKEEKTSSSTSESPQGNGDSAVSDELSGPRTEVERPERG